MNRRTDPDAVFRSLRPPVLDHLAEDGYARHRDADLSRIPASSGQRASRRRPRVVFGAVGGLAAVGLAAGVLAVMAGGTNGGSQAPGQPALTARSILLAGASTAVKAPAKTGAFWYERQRTTERITGYLKPGAKGSGKTARKEALKGSSAGVVPFSTPGTAASTEESWTGRANRSRTIVGIDPKVTLAPADQAGWKALGSPPVNAANPMKRTVSNYSTPIRFQIGNQQVSMAELAKLPTDPAKLEANLRRRYAADQADPREKRELAQTHQKPPTFTQVLWGTAGDLLAGPITPGTRAALYRVLADQDVKLAGAATDSLGRHGVAMELSHPRSGQDVERLIVNPKTGQLLGTEMDEQGGSGQAARVSSTTYEAMGWTDTIDSRP